jgi:acetyl-CoA carboxylase, biotin carboxylase subunit
VGVRRGWGGVKRLLVANRGEIAVRVIRAARDLGIETVAVHSEPDADTEHVDLADHVMDLGAETRKSVYRQADTLVAAALSSGCDAIHPGYGFLSEQAKFASACVAAGLTFVGPSATVIRMMGDKAAARQTAIEAGLPVVPGSSGAVSGVEEALSVAERVGYPVLLKAAGGGGGGGIRRIGDADALAVVFDVACGEASAVFGDGRLYVEKLIERARHIEVQVIGDGDHTIHLFDRECSLQRRRQKVLEEAPSPSISASDRARMTELAVSLAQSIGYSGAGTVEFILDEASGAFYFMEMNTRVQVEHPVTEVVVGIDIVAEQIAVAANGRLQLAQDDVRLSGAAIELRVCAEDPSHGFLPSPGYVSDVRLPAGPWVRVDTWLRPGTVVTPLYDSLLAKVVVLGRDRNEAIRRARRAVREIKVQGIATTAPLFERVLYESWFESGAFDTGTIERLDY